MSNDIVCALWRGPVEEGRRPLVVDEPLLVARNTVALSISPRKEDEPKYQVHSSG